ncbi:MAG: hypothetical protein QXP36_13300 [Conexivisphaerales archaeon]
MAIIADLRSKKIICVEVNIKEKGCTQASLATEYICILESSGMGIRKFYGDGAFDQSQLLDKLHSIGSEP